VGVKPAPFVNLEGNFMRHGVSYDGKTGICSLCVLFHQGNPLYAVDVKKEVSKMDLVKIGAFLQALRKEKGLTQEQIAEQIGVSRRTVSRWETGSNMPDLDVLMELSDFYAVDLREILNGERKSEHMNEELKETVLQVADYSNEEKTRLLKRMHWLFIAGLVGFVVFLVIYFTGMDDVQGYGTIAGLGLGIAFGMMIR
jgi:transcriptional regulator with XRE-family HTH domain